MTTGEDRNKDPFKNWKLCGLWKLPFRHQRALKLTESCVCFTNPCINPFVPTSVTREYYLKKLRRLNPLQIISAHLQTTLPWASWETSIFLVLIFVPAWSPAAENRSNASWRPCWEDPRVQYQFIRKKQTVHPAVPNSDTLVDASVAVSIPFI